MKTQITLFTTLLLIFSAAKAQFSENFDQNITGLSGKCWHLDNINYTTTAGDVINGTGSAYTNPPTSSSGLRTIQTPFLKVNTSTLTVSFNYKTSSKISGNATRTIDIGLTDKNGVFTLLQTITMDKNTSTGVLNLTNTYPIATQGVYRLEIRIGGANGDGNSRVILDDLSVSASPYYTGFCNSAAVAVDNTFTSGTISSISGNVITNDNIPADNDTYTAVLVSAPATGSVVLNGDGTFTYTPAPGYTGGTIVFSYQINDNGYAPTSSNTALVTLNFPAPAILPIRLISFTSDVEGNVVRLIWKAETTEFGEYFDIEKSEDGKQFVSFAKIKAEHAHGVNEYSANDNKSQADVYYRLKMVNNDGSVYYSKVLVIRNDNQSINIKLLNNPAISSLNVNYQTETAKNNTIRVYSISGVKVYEAKLIAVKGLNKLTIPVQSFPTGTYVLIIDAAASTKFIKG